MIRQVAQRYPQWSAVCIGRFSLTKGSVVMDCIQFKNITRTEVLCNRQQIKHICLVPSPPSIDPSLVPNQITEDTARNRYLFWKEV